MITSNARSVATVAVLSKGSVKQTNESVDDIYGVQTVSSVSLNLILTVLVESTLGSMLPVNVKLSPPSKLKELLGNMLVKTHVIVSADTVSFTGMIPRLLVKIGMWSPQVGFFFRVHCRLVPVNDDSSTSHSERAYSTLKMSLMLVGRSVPVIESRPVSISKVKLSTYPTGSTYEKSHYIPWHTTGTSSTVTIS
jgi:hypothetical protein